GAMSSSEKDAGFCSGGDEDDMSDLRSPSASEDSLEVQVTPISLKNKRKLAEPRKIHEPSTAPLKKRRFQRIEEETVPDEESTGRTLLRSPSPFRPWSYTSSKHTIDAKHPLPLIATAKEAVLDQSTTCVFSLLTSLSSSTVPPTIPNRINNPPHHHHHRHHHHHHHHHPLRKKFESQSRESSRIENREVSREKLNNAASTPEATLSPTADKTPSPVAHPRGLLQEEPLSLVLRGDVAARVPSHPAVNGNYEKTDSYSVERANVLNASSLSSSLLSSLSSSSSLSLTSTSSSSSHRSCSMAETTAAMITAVVSTSTTTVTMTGVQNSLARQHPTTAGQQRNYKNMTRERRIEANARERTRVHTISAAFDTLRRAIPAYSHNQKLSKLSVLRIACSYIMTLGKIVDITDEGQPINGASLGACVDLVSKTIQTEGKLRKRKED
ncbi:unnamed protein product, partial [Heterotrigona itama]